MNESRPGTRTKMAESKETGKRKEKKRTGLQLAHSTGAPRSDAEIGLRKWAKLNELLSLSLS